MLPRHELNTIAPCGQRENQQRFHDSELIADALPRSTAERQVGEARAGHHALWRESLWIELLRIRPEFRPAVNDERDDEHERTRRHQVATELIVSKREPGKPPGRGKE